MCECVYGFGYKQTRYIIITVKFLMIADHMNEKHTD